MIIKMLHTGCALACVKSFHWKNVVYYWQKCRNLHSNFGTSVCLSSEQTFFFRSDWPSFQGMNLLIPEPAAGQIHPSNHTCALLIISIFDKKI